MISIVMKGKGDVLSVTVTSIKAHRHLRGVGKTSFLICFDQCERCVLLCKVRFLTGDLGDPMASVVGGKN